MSYSSYDNGSSNRPPLLDKDDFSGWKGRMSLFLESHDHNMPDILRNGPHVPTETVATEAVVREGKTTIPASVRVVVKDSSDWSDEDRRKANLDVRARNFIVQAVPKDIYHSIKMCSTAKKMWETLTVMFEGCSTSMESTITTLTRKYERFFSLKNESLTDTHTRFNALVNDLIAVGITKTNETLKSKFLDSLPPKWNGYISSVKLSPIYRELDLPGLYGLLRNQENSEAEKLIAMGDSYGHSQAALVANQSNHPSTSSKEINSVATPSFVSEKPSDYATYLSEDDCEKEQASEDDDEGSLAHELALLADRFKKKAAFKKFPRKNFPKEKKQVDYSKVTCYNCNKTGHIASECRSKPSTKSEPAAPKKDDKYSKLKLKYKKLKAQVAKLSEKSLVAKKDWLESDTSSDDEEFEDAQCFIVKQTSDSCQQESIKCLMAKESAQKFLSDMSEIREHEAAPALIPSSSTVEEVSTSETVSKSENMVELTKLEDGLLLQRHINGKLKSEISLLKETVSKKDSEIEKLKSEIKAQKNLNSILIQEEAESRSKFLKIKTITESWCLASKRAAKCINDQLPTQIQAIFDGDYDRAVAISEICAMEPCFQPPPPPIITTKGKKSKPIKTVIRNGVGFDEPEADSKTISESVASENKSLILIPEENLDLSKLSISKPDVFSKGNKRKDRDLCSPRLKKKQSRKEKAEKSLSKTQSEPVPKTKPDTDSMVSKLIQSRLNNIANEVEFLKTMSESVDEGKLKNDLKKAGIGKGCLKPETLELAKKNFKSGKGIPKQQWVSKGVKLISSSDQSESDPKVSSGEPIARWVPKKN